MAKKRSRFKPVAIPKKVLQEQARTRNLQMCDLNGSFTSSIICGLKNIKDEFLGDPLGRVSVSGVARTSNQMLTEIDRYAHAMSKDAIKKFAKKPVTGVLRKELSEISDATHLRGLMPKKLQKAIQEKAEQLIRRVANYDSRMGEYCGYSGRDSRQGEVYTEAPLKPLPQVKGTIRPRKKRKR